MAVLRDPWTTPRCSHIGAWRSQAVSLYRTRRHGERLSLRWPLAADDLHLYDIREGPVVIAANYCIGCIGDALALSFGNVVGQCVVQSTCHWHATDLTCDVLAQVRASRARQGDRVQNLRLQFGRSGFMGLTLFKADEKAERRTITVFWSGRPMRRKRRCLTIGAAPGTQTT